MIRTIKTAGLALLLTLVGTVAHAQQTVLQGGAWVTGHVPIYAPGSGGFQPVIVDSGAAPAVINAGSQGQLGWYAASGVAISGNANATMSSGALTLGQTGSFLGSLKLSGSGSGAITIQPQSVAGTFNFNLPTTAGALNQPLISAAGGSSPMTWGSLSGNTSTFATTSGSLTSGHCAVFDVSGNLIDNGSGCGGSGTVNAGSAGQFAYYASSTNAVSGSAVLSVSGSTVSTSGNLTVGGNLTASSGTDTLSPSNANVLLAPTGTGFVTVNPATAGTINNMVIGGSVPLAATFTSSTTNNNLNVGVAGVSTGQILMSGSSSGTITMKPQNAAGTYNWNYPTTAGTSGQPLLSGGGGATAMSWGSLSGNTSTFATSNGALTSGHCASFDVSGNVIDAGFACSSGSGTVNSGTAGQLPYYATSTNAVTSNANLSISAGAFTIGQSGSVLGSVLLAGSSSGTVTIKPQGAAGTYNLNLPTTAGSSGQPLLSQGGGATAMTWGSLQGTGANFATTTGSFTTGDCVQVNASGTFVDNGTPCGSGGSGTVTSSTAGQIGYYPNSNNVIAGNSNVTVATAAGVTTFTVGVSGTNSGAFAIPGSSSGTITLKPQTAAGTFEWDWPTTAGSAGQVLTSQGGAGTAMTWTTPGQTWGGRQTTNFNAAAGTVYCVDTSGGAVTMTLPASPSDGNIIGFTDCKHTFATNNLIIARNGNSIMGSAANMTVNSTNAALNLVWSSAESDWVAYP